MPDHCTACPFSGCEACRYRWVCAFVACGVRPDQPHVPGCPYDTEETR